MFSLELVQVVSDWQRKAHDRKHRLKKARALQEHCSQLPQEFRQTSLTCYRQMALDKGSVWNLLGAQQLDEQVSSWTLDMATAKTLFGGVSPADTGFTEVIFAIYPTADQVVVNLKTLLDCPEFRVAVEAYKGRINYFSDGLGKYDNEQSEVVLSVGALHEQDIWTFGGRSSSFDELVGRAFITLYHRMPSAEEFQSFRSRLNEMENQAGARWLTFESSHSLLSRMRPRIDQLRAIDDERRRLRAELDDELRGEPAPE